MPRNSSAVRPSNVDSLGLTVSSTPCGSVRVMAIGAWVKALRKSTAPVAPGGAAGPDWVATKVDATVCSLVLVSCDCLRRISNAAALSMRCTAMRMPLACSIGARCAIASRYWSACCRAVRRAVNSPRPRLTWAARAATNSVSRVPKRTACAE